MKLYSWGANNYGQLGIGRICEQCNEPTEVSQTKVDFDNIISIKGGGGHTLILDKNGQVFGSGLNSSCQLALDSDKILAFERIKCLDKYNISQVVCGWDCSYAITVDRRVLVWGSNTYGQLGIPKTKAKKIKEPVEVALNGVVQISCGLRHTAALLSDGKVMIAGQGRKGQLGIMRDGCPLTQTDCFEEVVGAENVKMIACGQNYTLALTSNGKLLCWGDNKHGQLGYDPAQCSQFNLPFSIQSTIDLSSVAAIKAGWTHSVFLTDNGSLINNGRNCYGQLGSCIDARVNTWVLRTGILDKQVRQLEVGSEHNFVLSDDGELWSWGWNEHGSCGLGNDVNAFQPAKLKLPSKAVLIGTGSAHSFVLTED